MRLPAIICPSRTSPPAAPRAIVLASLASLASLACASSAASGAPPAVNPGGSLESPDGDLPLRRAPWTATAAAEGGFTYAHAAAGVRFGPRVQGIDRQQIVVYDAATPEVGFFYQGFLEMNGASCQAKVSVFVYPAPSADADQAHFAEVVGALRLRNPQAQPAAPLVDLAPAHGGPLLQAAMSNTVNERQVDEMVSLARRGPWFVKYRSTTAPAGSSACRLGLLAFIASLQSREDRRPPSVTAWR